jgi:adenosylmethionine-8-amino-7-oxononanoate aminotransferase
MVDVSGPVNNRVTTQLRGYWPPMTSLRSRADEQTVIVRGEGARLWDDEGREYLDATASLWYANVGHGRERIAAAVADQLRVLAAYSNFGRFATEPTLRLTERIAGLAPLDDPLVFLTSGGSDAVDTAVKMVRRYWTLQDKPSKVGMISRQRSYHGMHGFGTALAGIEANATGYGEPTEGGFVRAPVNDVAAVRAQIEDVGADRLGAVFAEPVIGAGGIVPPSDKYLNELRDVCDQYELLLVADEVVTGFGRLGTWFGCERFDITPDLLLFAKGVTSGYMPLGGVVASRRIWEPFYADGSMFRHGYTYSGHAAACAAAIENLDIIVDEDLLGRVRELEPVLASSLAPLAEHRLVDEVRSVGLLTAVQLDTDDLKVLDQVVARAREHGVLTRGLTGAAIQVSPPFTITEGELATMAGALKNALDDVADLTP